jgi:hypothetical protein
MRVFVLLGIGVNVGVSVSVGMTSVVGAKIGTLVNAGLKASNVMATTVGMYSVGKGVGKTAAGRLLQAINRKANPRTSIQEVALFIVQ